MMDQCMKSFTISLYDALVFGTTVFTEWNSLGTVKPWIMVDGSASRKTEFFLEGFKNIDVYGVSMVGSVYPLLAPAQRQALVEDWGVLLLINGTTQLVNGFFGTNTFSGSQGSKRVFLSKYQNEYKLMDPIMSVQSITVEEIQASGIQNEASSSVDLLFNISLIVYYKLEGE